MTTYDVAMVIVVVLGLARGAWRGFTWQLASIASLVLGYTAAHTSSAQIASYLPGEPEAQRVLAMCIVYIIVSGGIFGIAWLIRGTLRKLRFEEYDRHLGMLLGGLEGVGVGMLVTLLVVTVSPATRQPIFSSTTGQVVGTVMNNLGPILPDEIRKALAAHWDGSFSRQVDAQEADGQAIGTVRSGGTPLTVDITQLPAPHEAAKAIGSPASPATPGLPDLESPTDPTVRRAGNPFRSDWPPKLDGPQRTSQLDDILEEGREKVGHVVSDTIDRQFQRVRGFKPAKTTDPK
jgi:membrane protein required for colicin V production